MKIKTKKWLKLVADIMCDEHDHKYYESKYDSSYLGHVDLSTPIFDFLAEHGVTKELTSSTGFSPSENKWYGWSHRAIYGFTIGDQVKLGDIAYVPSNRKEVIADVKQFWEDETRTVEKVEFDSDELLTIYFKNKTNATDNIASTRQSYRLGKGAYIAKTIEDAKQMAIDFAADIA